jgi:hypothetical protein
MSFLNDLFLKYGTDKGDPPQGWGYTPYYEEAMEARRFDVKNVLEIGICGFRDIPNNVIGASLFAWRDYFPNATIYGIDNDPRFVFNDQERIVTACCDAYDRAAMHRILTGWDNPWFDMIVDDAVHDPLPQLQLMSFLEPELVEGGRYFVEEACPYKVSGDILDFYKAGLHDKAFRVLTACVTHKPEELVIGVK